MSTLCVLKAFLTAGSNTIHDTDPPSTGIWWTRAALKRV